MPSIFGLYDEYELYSFDSCSGIKMEPCDTLIDLSLAIGEEQPPPLCTIKKMTTFSYFGFDLHIKSAERHS